MFPSKLLLLLNIKIMIIMRAYLFLKVMLHPKLSLQIRDLNSDLNGVPLERSLYLL